MEQTVEQTIDLMTIPLGHGLGTADEPCSVAAVNLMLAGKLSDQDPTECMSEAVRRWVVRVQDAMPVEMMAPDDEHGVRWRRALIGLAGSRTTGPSDDERVAIVLEWMWTCLGWNWREWVPESAHEAWGEMLDKRTAAAARAARAAAARAADTAAAARAADTAAAAYAVADAADAAADAARDTADAARDTAAAAYAVADAARTKLDFWRAADPAAVLTKLVAPQAG